MAEGGEVSGYRSTTGSEFVLDLYCEICKDDGKHLEVEGYCVDCDDYLCGDCYTHHKKARPSRQHELLDRERMPKKTPPSSDEANKSISTKCSYHKGKFVEYFCKSHDAFGCSSCFKTTHSSCSDIECISDNSEGILDGQEYHDFMQELQSLEQRSRDTIKQSHDNVSRAESQFSKAVQAVKQFREEINSILDKMESSLKAKAEKIKTDDTEKLGPLSEMCNSILTSIETAASKLRKLEASKQVCQLYITMKEEKTKVASLKTGLDEAKNNNNEVRMYSFEHNRILKEFLNSPEVLGNITILHPRQHITSEPKDIKATHIADIDVMPSCTISGSAVLSRTRLVIADKSQKTVKLLDTRLKKLISELTFPSNPCDIAVIRKNQVAVTFSDISKIRILRVADTLALEREITVDDECLGIAYSLDRFLVTYANSNRLDIMDLWGNVIKTIVKDGYGCSLFRIPEHVCVSSDNLTIYVSDNRDNLVVRLTFEGRKMAHSTGTDLKYPRKLCVDHRGYVYVCHNANNVHIMTADLRKTKPILIQSNRRNAWPSSVSHCKETDRLYVGVDGIVKVYALS